MNDPAAQDALVRHARLFHDTGRAGVFAVARRPDAVDLRLLERPIDHRLERLGGVAFAPMGAGDAIAGVGLMAVDTQGKAADQSAVRQADRPSEFGAGLPAVDAALQKLAGIAEVAVRRPDHVAGDLGILGVGRENGLGVSQRHRAQQQPGGAKCGRWYDGHSSSHPSRNSPKSPAVVTIAKCKGK